MLSSVGKDWLLLRGLTREAAHWGEFPALLRSRFPSANISTLDLPGTGVRHREISPWHMAEIAESVREKAIEQGVTRRPITLVGLSLGGMVAWEWMLRHPEDACGAVLINTSQAGLNPFYQRLSWRCYPHIFNLLLQPNRFRRELAIIRCVANRRDRETLALEWENIQSERPVSIANAFRQLMAATSYRAGGKRPELPMLLLSGRGDRLVAPACSDTIHRKWQIPIECHPWAGHDLTLDDGAWVADRLRIWVERLKAS
ncbi:MAG: alpha/beta fold hydrolase [Gammaproteobacteria bacterium]